MKTLITIPLLVVFSAMPNLAQQPATKNETLRADPFSIEYGRTFSASSGEDRRSSGVQSFVRERGRIEQDLVEALRVIERSYAGATPDQISLVNSAIDGALLALDPHSTYFDRTEFRQLIEEQQSEYSGIGATISNFKSAGLMDTYVVATFGGSPAAARLVYGDRIVEVDGKPVGGLSSDDVRDMIRGRSGTIVRLLIDRAATGKLQTIELKRSLVSQPTIADSYMLPNGIGYIDMTAGFSFTTAGEFNAALKNLHRQGMNGLIIDLRGNPGGILQQAVQIAEKFLPAGAVILSQRGRAKIDDRVWRSANRIPDNTPLVVLVDVNSASASEILAGALQDHDRALIVGERTFGKGLVQSIIDLPGGSGLTLTTARYFTPSGRSIQRDYSSGNLYDYYNHRGATGTTGPQAATTNHRKVFGGDGIQPDEPIAASRISRSELELLDSIFFFTRAIVTNRPSDQQKRVSITRSSGDIADGIISDFAGFTAREGSSEPAFGPNETTFVKTRLKFSLMMAEHGATAANRVLISADPQVARAAEVLPRARQLAMSSRKTAIRQ